MLPISSGDMIRIHFDGLGSFGETLDGIVLNVFFVDHLAKLNRDNNSRWISSRMLVDGRPRVVDLYHDDEIEIINSSC
jgi:hypothetical protein